MNINKDKNLERFKKEHPDVLKWIEDSGDYHFALSMMKSVLRYGSLTERQLFACYKSIESLDKIKKELKETSSIAKSLGLDSIYEVQSSIDNAKSFGVKNPKLKMIYGEEDELTVYPASKRSINYGSLYVKSNDGLYLGRVTNGVFYNSREVDSESSTNIISALKSPLDSCKAYGRLTGLCPCCGKEFEDFESKENGIDKTCFGKYFS